MPVPEFWLVAGPNGAGKTTAMAHPIVRSLISHVRFLNPDDRTLEKLKAEGWSGFASVPAERLRELFVEAASEVHEELCCALESGAAVGTETVLSTTKYQPVVEAVLRAGGIFGLLYIALESPTLSARRVASRTALGGHDVPPDKFVSRWQRSVEKLGWFARRADRFWIYDNSDSGTTGGMLLIAAGGAGEVTIHTPDAIPEITASLTAAFT